MDVHHFLPTSSNRTSPPSVVVQIEPTEPWRCTEHRWKHLLHPPPSTRYFVIIPWSWFKIIGGCYSSDFSEIDDTYDKILFVIVKGDLYSSIKGLHSLAYYLTYFLPSLSAIFSACAFRLFMCCTQASCWVLCRGVFLLWHKKKRLRIKLMRKPFLFNFE